MEANNHFNYGTHSSANSGLKLSSGESPYTNGSSTSFPQQGKNLNGEINVNGITTVVGPGVSGSQQPTASYPHLTNHHQSSRGYDYLWGGHPQYGPLGSPHGHGVHQKHPSPGLGQPLSQPHYQSRGPYQLNGRIEGSRQPTGVGPPNMSMGAGQYWNNNSQHINFSPHSLYGTYHSPALHQQQSVQPSQPQPSSQQLHPHCRPLHPHQQQQHYGLMPNGMPYYQQQPSQPQNQAHIMPTLGQSYNPPHGSSLPVSSTSVRSPSSTKDSVSPQRPSRDRSPDINKAGPSTVTQDGEKTSNDKERASQKWNDDQPKEAASHTEDFSLQVEKSPTRSSNISSPKREPAAKATPETSLASAAVLSTSPQASRVTVSPQSSVQSEPPSKDTTPQMSSPPSASSLSDALQHSSPPFRSVLTGRNETTNEATTNMSMDASSNAVATGSSPGRPFFSSVQQQAKGVSGSPVTSPASSPQVMMPSSTLPKHVQGSAAPQTTACFPNSTDGMSEEFIVSALTSTNSSVSVIARAEGNSALAPATSLHYEVAPPHPTAGCVTGTPVSPSTETHRTSFAGNDVSTARPLSSLPRLTTQASRTAPASVPAESVSVPHVTSAPSGVIQSSTFEQHSLGAAPTHALQSAVADHLGHCEDRRQLATSDMHDRNLSHLESAAQRIPYHFKAAEKPDLPVQHLPTIVSPVHKPHDRQTSFEHMQRALNSERSAVIQGRPSQSSRVSYLSNESSYLESSYMEDSKNASLFIGDTSEELSTAYTTRESSFSAEGSRDDTLASTTAGESTQESFHGAESSLNSTSQMEEPSIGSTDVSMLSHSYASSQQSHQGYAEQWSLGQDTPDSAGRSRVKPFGIMTPPSFRMSDGFMAFSTPAESPALNLIPSPMKSPGKPRKPRTPKDSQTPEQAQRKPRGRTPKIKTGEESENQEEGAKPKVSRKRKKASKDEPTEAGPGMPGSVTDELDTIAATIEAVLASVATLTAADLEKPKKKRRKKQQPEGSATEQEAKPDAEATADDGEDHEEDGDSSKRRVASEEQVQFPLQHGWRREIRVRKVDNRMRGETWYYTPCGRRMKQFPEIIKYLKKHQDSVVSREHFSFSPRMPVGDFYEEKETPGGLQWVLLANEEIPSTIMAITGRRGRPPNPDKEKLRRADGPPRRPGRPPKPKMIDFLSKADAKLLQQLEAKETLTDEDKGKIAKIKKKMKKKARLKRKQDAKIKKIKEEKKKAKLEQATTGTEGKPETTDQSLPESAEPKKRGRRRIVKPVAPVVQLTDEERIAQGKRVLGARSKAKALAKAQAEAEAVAQAAQAAKRAAERRVLAQKRLEERRRQQLIAEELKKPTEDMCLTDHKLLPELSRIPGVVLSGTSFAHCLSVMEFLHAYGKLLGLNIPKDVPSLATLQEGLLGLGDSQGEIQDLVIKLLEIALQDPGLPSHYQSVKILGDKLVDLELTRSTVSEVLRIFLESHGYETEVCDTLRTKTFQALPPDTKASILSFLVDELNGSNIVTNDIDNTLENMSSYRKNKWIIEGKLRRLKEALARRTGRSEEEICFEERRRSARVAEEETQSLESSGRGRRRKIYKEDPKLSDSESPTNASIPELERHIDKLTKRQAFFRKKLLQSSQTMRAILLGQDRYRRRYIALPNLGMVLVEGPEEILTSEDVLVAEVPVTFLKKELKKEIKTEETPVPTTPPSTVPSSPSLAAAAQAQSPHDDPLPGTASLMSRPRGRGRPRKIKPEVELHLRTAKIRRRRRSSARSGSEEGPGSPHSELTQAALRLSQSQEALSNGIDSSEGNTEESVKDMAEKQGQWFNLLPKQPCDEKSLSDPQTPASPQSPPKLSPQMPRGDPSSPTPTPAQLDLQSNAPDAESDPQSCAPPDLALTEPERPTAPAEEPCSAPHPVPSVTDLVPAEAEAVPQLPEVLPPALESNFPPIPVLKISRPAPGPHMPGRPGRRRRRGSRGSSPARRGARGAAARRRGRPATSVFQELEQQYFTQLVVRPIPASMARGWWWIKSPEELYSTLQALHPRGVRERVLHKHLAKHMESLSEMCTKSINDPLFDMKVEQKDGLLEALQQPWQVQERAMETDISALKWVEELEQRVVAADLHLRAPPQSTLNEGDTPVDTPVPEFQPYTVPEPDSTREDLLFYEHDADPRDDWTIRTKKEWSGLPRIPTHPLDLAVLRLTNLERNIERKYLKEPLWNPSEVMRLAPLTPTPGEEQPMDVFSLENEITSRLRIWRQALDRCRSAPQVCLCLLQLEKAIAWERSVTKVTCQVCRKGDNDDCLLLCDGCDRGCHMYCLRPKMTQVPEGDWFCPTCVAKNIDCELDERSCKKRTRVKKRRYEDDSSEDETTTRRSGGMATRHKEPAPAQSSPRPSAEAAAAKRRRMVTRNQPDLTFCEIILMEMEAHADAWPFLEPVNPRLVPGYRRIIKNPMDFLTMRERLLQGAYCSCEDFAADAHLIFSNCELFNEDTSEVGMAGHSMSKFFESRWAEFYADKDK